MKKVLSLVVAVGILFSYTSVFADGEKPIVKGSGTIVTNYDPGNGGG